jgi:hypothetical protein
LPELASDFRPAIAVNELLKLATESDGVPPALALADEVEGVEELLELLLHAPMRRAAVVAATAVRPALADMEYNDVPRLFSRDMLVTCT